MKTGKQMKGDRGSILMEYVILTFFVAVPFYLVWNGCSVPVDWFGAGKPITYPGIYDFATGQYKGNGLRMKKFFEMVQDGIALPIP